MIKDIKSASAKIDINVELFHQVQVQLAKRINICITNDANLIEDVTC